MENWAKELASLGFSEHTYSETIVVSQGPAGLTAAPMGILLSGENLLIQPYRDTRTYANLVSSKNCTINITHSSLLFYKAVMKSFSRRSFAKSKVVDAPRLRGVDAVVEATLLSVVEDLGDRAKLLLKPAYLKVFRRKPKTYNRADSLLIEALVYYTKIQPYMKMGKTLEVKKFIEGIEHCCKTLHNVSTDVMLKKAASQTLRKSKEYLRVCESSFA
ncbi:MAG: hypothetical protein DRJ31_03745 [Candidatus Methanomethylicota archaeon]|uniref:DUF447 domain-containing protein n=1 Tax=Thermoproteota archaeon TaxID=2056631 RepID=A0A497ERU3_9CREN|nr:MAG: hypothetical protein DRJ31_03745 [Candidatus Verstraetearchaeota archaeon]RLE52660.1 MAG: hypothetical protein DRJ33_03195 [Candidatus Verstraetearchaeota archaeon]